MRKVDYIVLHCTGGPQNQSLESIQSHWRNVMRWRTPGYHRLVAANGTVHELAPYSAITNGVEGNNRNAIHISYVGGVDDRGRVFDTRTQAQRRELERLVREAHELYPKAIIQGHRDFSPDKNRNGIIEPSEWKKACPSFSVKAWLKEIGFKSSCELKMYFASQSNVNMRAGAGLNFPVLATIPAGDKVQLIAHVPGWMYVQRPDGLMGYMSTGLMKEVRP